MKSEPKMLDKVLFCHCRRCGVRLQVGPAPGSEARLLRRSKVPKGLCVNCAVHNFLRNTYPPNIQLAESGPGILLLPHLQKIFTNIMRAGFADAVPEEIDWQMIVFNWELPFREKVKPSASNPCDQDELDAIAAGTHPGHGEHRIRASVGGALKARKELDRSFEGLNKIMPGLGDSLKNCLQKGEQSGEPEK